MGERCNVIKCENSQIWNSYLHTNEVLVKFNTSLDILLLLFHIIIIIYAVVLTKAPIKT